MQQNVMAFVTPSDLTDAEWAIAGPVILDGIFCVPSTGCQWRALPKDLPPKSTVRHSFMLWDWEGGHWNTFIMRSYVAVREQAGREASPTKAIFDSSKAPRARKKGELARSGDGIALVLNRRASATAVIEERSFVLTWHISTMVNQG